MQNLIAVFLLTYLEFNAKCTYDTFLKISLSDETCLIKYIFTEIYLSLQFDFESFRTVKRNFVATRIILHLTGMVEHFAITTYLTRATPLAVKDAGI